jgi:hypothetical protein
MPKSTQLYLDLTQQIASLETQEFRDAQELVRTTERNIRKAIMEAHCRVVGDAFKELWNIDSVEEKLLAYCARNDYRLWSDTVIERIVMDHLPCAKRHFEDEEALKAMVFDKLFAAGILWEFDRYCQGE